MADEEDNITEEEEEEEEQEEQNSEEEQELDDKDEKIKELKEELEKERNKEKNFKNLKETEKGKRMKISERVEQLENLVKQEQENRQNLQSSIMKDAKATAIKQLAGDDENLQVKLDERVKASEAYLGAPKDSKELIERYENAYSFIEGAQKRVNPINAYTPPLSNNQNALGGKQKRFRDTNEGNELFKKKFPQLANLEKKDKK